LDSCRRGSSDIQMGPGHGRELGPKSKGSLLEEGSISPYENMLQFSRSRYVPSWTVHMKFLWMLDQRNTLVFALIVRQLWKPLRLLKQCPHWYNSAKRHWMTFLLGILWDHSGSPGTLGQCFSTFVRPWPGTFFFYKMRAWSQQIYS
jgi:hypothetical protein